MSRQPPKLPDNATAGEYELWRKEIQEYLLSQRQQNDARYQAEVDDAFTARAGLDRAISSEVLPSIVTIETLSGRIGMAFYQHTQWLTSNAHVIRHHKDIARGITLKKANGEEHSLVTEQAFHRPYQDFSAPDIVIIKTPSNSAGNSKGLQIRFPEADIHSDHIYFYLDTDFVYHELVLVSPLGEVPLRFLCQDGKPPPRGCSGTPVFAARLDSGHENIWQFKVVGTLFARQINSKKLSASQVFVVPVSRDFEQIRLSILAPQESSKRQSAMSAATNRIGDKERAADYEVESRRQQQLAENGFRQLSAGDSVLTITLPDDLERLDGDRVRAVAESHLVAYKYLAKAEIVPSFDEFVELVQAQGEIALRTQDDLLHDKYWRVDCKSGESGRYWVLELQDKLPRGKKINGKSASSTFALVKLPKSISSVGGAALANALRVCQANVAGHEELLARANSSKKDKKQALIDKAVQTYPTTIVVGLTEGHDEEVYRYAPPEESARQTMSPAIAALFIGLAAETTHGEFRKRLYGAYSGSDDPVQAANFEGNTMLMLLLMDPNLSRQPEQLQKARTLVEFGALWDRRNNAGETAESLLDSHADKDELTTELRS